ncbi:MAG: 3-oxoacyl-ACP reductase FabG [Planctomycetes bacterium]|nr:3-oxoacyl-ACP reductase FabG [Planctomycetota bacterium]
MIPISLEGKVAIVTGASQGIGEATARCLAEAGATVCVNYFEEGTGANRELAEGVATACGPGAFATAADVRSSADVERLFDDVIARAGGLDILVNNAGIIRDGTCAKLTEEEWDAVVDTNLKAAFLTAKQAATRMRKGGRIINLSSVSAFLGFFGQINYAASKGGLVSMTRVLARELAKRSITVNAVAPGIIQTTMLDTIPGPLLEAYLQHVPLGRTGSPRELANAILFLASDLASFVTGQTLHVNGGMYAG